jgi:hypothetical protein
VSTSDAGESGRPPPEAGGLVDALWQAARVAERRAASQLARLARLAGGTAIPEEAPPDPQPGPAGPPHDPYWITAEAVRQRHLRERRLLVAAAALVAELGQWEAPESPPPPPPPESGARPVPAEWGRTDAALEYWMRREGWRRASPVALRAFLAAAGGGGWCVHCGQPALELRLFVQDEEGQDARYRAFSRCGACGLVGELQPGTALAAAGLVAPPPPPPAPSPPPPPAPSPPPPPPPQRDSGYG